MAITGKLRAIVTDTPDRSIYTCINDNREIIGGMHLHKAWYKEELGLKLYKITGRVPPGYRIIKDEGVNLNYPINIELACSTIKEQSKALKEFNAKFGENSDEQ